MIAHHTSARSERIEIFADHDEFSGWDNARGVEVGPPLITAGNAPDGWHILIDHQQTNIRYPDFKVGTNGKVPFTLVSNLCIALGHGIKAAENSKATVATI